MKKIAYLVDVQLTWSRDTLAGYGLTNLWRQFWGSVNLDHWGLTVKGRIEYYLRNLHAADGLYHHSCSVFFRSFKSVPMEFQNAPDAKSRRSGRPKDEDKHEAFKKMCAYLELNSEEKLTVTSLRLIMEGYFCNPDSEVYDNYSLKNNSKEHFKDSIHFCEGEGFDKIVTMREQTSVIMITLQEKVKNPKNALLLKLLLD